MNALCSPERSVNRRGPASETRNWGDNRWPDAEGATAADELPDAPAPAAANTAAGAPDTAAARPATAAAAAPEVGIDQSQEELEAN